MEGRNRLFQKLKPPCVGLSQVALELNGSRASTDAVTNRLEDVKARLESLIATDSDSFDDKLADYVFFPISHVLKLSHKVPIRSLELSLECISILIVKGWGWRIQPQLATQVVILCTLMAEKKPSGFSFDTTTDELKIAAFHCMQNAFYFGGQSAQTKELLTSEASFPQLGQTFSTIIDGIMDGDSVGIQVAATRALESLVEHIIDDELSAAFLPGIVSKLTKVLTPSTKQRRNHIVLVSCVGVLASLLKRTMGKDFNDTDTISKLKADPITSKITIIDSKWQENASKQLQVPLTTVMRLKKHDREDVRLAVAELCFMMIRSCQSTLQSTFVPALETLISIAVTQDDTNIRNRLESMLSSVTSTPQLALEITYRWLQSLPTIMQSADEQAKMQILQEITTAYELISNAGIDTSIIDRMLAGSLRESVVVTLQMPKAKSAQPLVSTVQSLDLTMLDRTRGFREFGPVLAEQRGQEKIISNIERMTRGLNQSSSTSIFAGDLSRGLRLSQDEPQIANFWLMLTAVETALTRKSPMDDFLSMERDDLSIFEEYLEELYSFAISILTEISDIAPDHRLQRLALRTLAMRARNAGEEFRCELIDSLYPVLHALASSDERLQHDSIVTLNTFTAACKYESVRDLIVENVDYLTNAVALKLNAYDISPQAPQVLLMMVRLAGPSLLPYLEDTVESIFAALEDYHGYPMLVELLFKVLSMMIEEGVKTPQLMIDQGQTNRSGFSPKETWQVATIQDLDQFIRDHMVDDAKFKEQASLIPESYPKAPWKDTEDFTNEHGPPEETESEAQDRMEEEVPPPAPKIYNLLLKITDLTQHFLPSASTSLRSSLLNLIRQSVPALSRHENSFLPLINTLWPEITARLDDGESHVKATALEIIAIMCHHAGDFMRSRIVDLWPGIREFYEKTISELVATSRPVNAKTAQNRTTSSKDLAVSGTQIKQLVQRMRSSPATYSDTSARLLWESLVSMLTSVVQDVRLPAKHFEEALEMLQPVMEQEQVQRAVKATNADAAWLGQIRSGAIALPPLPKAGKSAGCRLAFAVV
ncbi:Hypothetical protein R9X50_00568900 [Acrodontium crateriforme]|uniref:ARM repeat-containing protein n=1 Tax=Acrodontium crateriforme TaxID=150365 RepID=A0AAQ3RB38_9PEZI|nr:Hypothetical protein R9X50_00568900 [Acrodontium crateriforme]